VTWQKKRARVDRKYMVAGSGDREGLLHSKVHINLPTVLPLYVNRNGPLFCLSILTKMAPLFCLSLFTEIAPPPFCLSLFTVISPPWFCLSVWLEIPPLFG
jgi:hypothetical protein